MNVYFTNACSGISRASRKAKADAEKIMAEEGFHRLDTAAGPLANVKAIAAACADIHEGDCLFLQYPLNISFGLLTRLARLKGAKVVALVHDLGSYRSRLTREIELNRLSNTDFIIASSHAIMDELKAQGVKVPMTALDAWDYLGEAAPIPSRIREEDEVRIAYAGEYNPDKNGFVWKWGDEIDGYVVDIFGRGFRHDQVAHPEKFFNHGFVDENRLIEGMTSDFGLVWDGDSTETCDGPHGRYMALNTPHKVSLYLRARLPIIIWSGAAMADFVTSNGLGFTIDSIADINRKIKELTPEQYAEMRRNVEAMSDKIASGYFLRKALADVK